MYDLSPNFFVNPPGLGTNDEYSPEHVPGHGHAAPSPATSSRAASSHAAESSDDEYSSEGSGGRGQHGHYDLPPPAHHHRKTERQLNQLREQHRPSHQDGYRKPHPHPLQRPQAHSERQAPMPAGMDTRTNLELMQTNLRLQHQVNQLLQLHAQQRMASPFHQPPPFSFQEAASPGSGSFPWPPFNPYGGSVAPGSPPAYSSAYPPAYPPTFAPPFASPFMSSYSPFGMNFMDPFSFSPMRGMGMGMGMGMLGLTLGLLMS